MATKKKLYDWALSQRYPTGDALKRKLIGVYGRSYQRQAAQDLSANGIEVSEHHIKRLVSGKLEDLQEWTEQAYRYWASKVPDFYLEDPRLQDPVMQAMPDLAGLIENQQEIANMAAAVREWMQEHRGVPVDPEVMIKTLYPRLVYALYGIDTQRAHEEMAFYEMKQKVDKRLKEMQNPG